MTETVHVGIDIGTTSAKCCARKGKEVILEFKQIYGKEGSGENEENGIQNPVLILKTVMGLLKKIQDETLKQNLTISDIWTCGQMHGIVFWNQASIGNLDLLVHSPLYNWTFSAPEVPEFLKTLPKWSSGELQPGFGLVTMAFLHSTDSDALKKFNRCGTIMDLFLTILTQNSQVFISHHNAHSWGYCTSDGTWQTETLGQLLPDFILLPKITKNCSEIVGDWNSVKCHVASGDLQASVASLEYLEKTAYIILGTSAQLCCLVDPDQLSVTVIPPSVVQLPYSNSKRLIAGCAMNGGNALESVMKMHHPESYSSEMLQSLLDELDHTVPQMPSNLKIDPVFIPERGTSHQHSIKGLESDTTDLQILEATHLGIIRNLFSLFPIPLLMRLNIRNLALVGSSQCPRFRRHIESTSNRAFVYTTPISEISTPFGATNLKLD